MVDTCYEEDLDDDDDNVDADGDDDDSESDEDDENYKNNSHLLSDVDGDPLPQRSNFVSYYDATSLYPSSGECENNSDFFQTRKRDQLTCVRPTLRVVARKLDGHGAGVWRGSGGPPPPPPRLPPTEPFDNSRRFLKDDFFCICRTL